MLNIRNSLFAAALCLPLVGCGDDGGTTNPETPDANDTDPGATCFDEAAFFKGTELANTFGTDPGLTAPTDVVEPNFLPQADAPVLMGGATPPAGFDTTATYIGAIGATDWTTGWTAYPTDTSIANAGTVTNVPAGDITADTTWMAGNTYVLQGPVFVTGGATLTIEPGTIVRGKAGDAKAVLVIANDGMIMAEGTADEPIVFTSEKTTGAAAGDWGGVVLLGKAPINVDGGANNIEGFEAGDPKTSYGGTDGAHNCGTLKYVRIEYAGYELSTDNELNGLTVGGCGTATELDYIQVHRGLDDGIEFFGGTAGLTHAVISSPDDDGLDWDQGWTGKVQWLIVQQDGVTGDCAFESDNNNNNNDATPRSKPEIWNFTLIGGGLPTQTGMLLRRGTGADLHNGIITNFGRVAIDVAGLSTVAQAEAGDLVVGHTYFFNNAGGDDWKAEFEADATMANDCTMPAAAR